MQILHNLKFEPERKQVYSRMGFKPASIGIPENMKSLVQEAILQGRELTKPEACYDYRPIRFLSSDRIQIEGGFIIQSRKVYHWMEGCEGLYLTAVTLGPGIDREVKALSQSGELTRAFLLNAYGAEAAEALMKRLNDAINDLAKKQGMHTIKRYSPGYGDWHISAQKELLGLIQAEQIGIQLTESFLMIPEKSVSAIIGVKRIGEGKNS